MNLLCIFEKRFFLELKTLEWTNWIKKAPYRRGFEFSKRISYAKLAEANSQLTRDQNPPK
jgi:hypothetical protein